MGRQNLFLSAGRVTKSTIVRYLFTILGGLLTTFFAIGLVLCLTDSSMRDDLWVALFLLIPSAWVLWKGIASGRDLELARHYQSVFAADAHGVVTLEELMRQTGKSGTQIAKELERLFRKSYFQGCTLRRGSRCPSRSPARSRAAKPSSPWSAPTAAERPACARGAAANAITATARSRRRKSVAKRAGIGPCPFVYAYGIQRKCVI